MTTKINKAKTNKTALTQDATKKAKPLLVRKRRTAEEVCDARFMELVGGMHKLAKRFPGRYGIAAPKAPGGGLVEDLTGYINKRHLI